uniref:Uncharacterized protein n=1 Tax=Anguilla anguilla TaxID=7936 RepID=A0A0E9T5U1_ANGAN
MASSNKISLLFADLLAQFQAINQWVVKLEHLLHFKYSCPDLGHTKHAVCGLKQHVNIHFRVVLFYLHNTSSPHLTH